MKKWYAISGLLFILLLCCALIPESADLSTTNDELTIVMPRSITRSTQRLIQKNLPYASVVRCKKASYGHPLEHLTEFETTAVWTNSIQVKKILKQNPGLFWTPYLETSLVLMINTQNIPDNITVEGFEDIQKHSLTLGACDSMGAKELLIGMDCILSEDKTDLNSLLYYLRNLHINGKFNFIKDCDWENELPNGQVFLMFSDIAKDLQRNDPKIKIVYPEEGTFKYTYGLLSKQMLPFPYFVSENTQGQIVYGEDLSDDQIRSYSHSYDHLTARMRREVLRQRLYGSADGTEHQMLYLVMEMILILWTAALYLRAVDVRMRKNLLVISCMMIGWILVRLVAYYSDSSSQMYRLSGYIYYLPFLFIPHYLLRVALDQSEGSRLYKISQPLFIIGSAIFILVLTNDIHGLLYREKSYGPLYAMVVLYVATQLIMTLYLMVRSSYSVPKKKRLIVPFIPFLLYAIYTWGYVMRIDFFIYSETTFSTSVLYLLFLEICYYAGIFSGAIRYDRFFAASDLPMVILDRSYQVKYRTDRMIPSELLEKGTQILREQETFSDHEESHHLLSGRKIQGGYILWWSDIRHIRELEQKLHQLLYQLEKDNELLAEREKIESDLATARWQNTIYQEIENQLAFHITEIQQRLMYVEEASDQELHRFLYSVGYSFRHLKRKAQLLIAGKLEEQVRADEILSAIQECIKVLRIRVDTICTAKAKIYASDALKVFDLLSLIVKEADRSRSPSILIRFSDRDKQLRCMIYINEADLQDWGTQHIESIRANEFSIQTRYDEKTKETVLTITIPLDDPKGERSKT